MRILDTQGRQFHPAFIADIPSGNLVWVDPVNGNDDMAVRGRMTVPFKTLGAAKTAASSSSGDTIMVLPGTYNEKNLLKNGVNWHFLPGAKVAYTGASAGGIFDDSSNGSNGAVTSQVTGYGEFEITATTGSGHVVHLSSGSSKLTLEAKSLSSVNTAIKITNGIFHGEISQDIIVDSADAITVSGGAGQNYLQARDIHTSGGRALYVSGSSSVLLDIVARRVTGTAEAAVSIQGGSGAVTIRAYELHSSAPSRATVHYNTTNGLVLTILGARIKNIASGAGGRSVQIDSNSSDKVKLANCVLIASTDVLTLESIYAANSGTKVHILNGAAANKDKHANVTLIGSTTLSVNSLIS